MRIAFRLLLLLTLAAGLFRAAEPPALLLPEEKHLTNARQLTFTGENAEAYFSADDRFLSFQSHEGRGACDQIYVMAADGSDLRRLTSSPGYDAEATLSRDGKKIVFTSTRDADLDLYVMDSDGKNVRRLTRELGYDGGAFFSPDGKKIVYRAHHPTDPAEVADYQALLADGLLRPSRLEIWVMDADGANKRQVTANGAANFAPYWHPDGRRIIFGSNMLDPEGRNFDLYLIHQDGTGLERITYHPDFDGFPMFSHDGRRLVWASNRNQRQRGDTNIFIADWVD